LQNKKGGSALRARSLQQQPLPFALRSGQFGGREEKKGSVAALRRSASSRFRSPTWFANERKKGPNGTKPRGKNGGKREVQGLFFL